MAVRADQTTLVSFAPLSVCIRHYLRCPNTQHSRRPDIHRPVFAEPNRPYTDHGRYLSPTNLQQFLLDAGLPHRPRRHLQETRTGMFILTLEMVFLTESLLSRLQGIAENDEIIAFVRVRSSSSSSSRLGMSESHFTSLYRQERSPKKPLRPHSRTNLHRKPVCSLSDRPSESP